MLHDDGDEEDMDEEEVKEAIQHEEDAKKAKAGRRGAGQVTEAEGLKLHLSDKIGLPGRHGGPRPLQGAAEKNGKDIRLGHFDTAVEAAVAYAKHVGPPPPPQVEVTEVNGLKLPELKSKTGYTGVRKGRRT